MSFSGDVAAWSEKTKVKLENAFRKVALSAFSEVIMMSPVDTGRFRSNWQVAIGSVPTGTIELAEWDKTKVTRKDKTGARKAKTLGDKASALAGQTAGRAVISKVEAETLKLKVGDVIYLVNNLPYAEALEFGHSKQAPAGMVRLTVQRWRPIVEAVGRELGLQ